MEDRERARGLWLGLAVGDSLGVPREGLSPRRARKIFGADPRHAFLLGRGMVSDDTELAVLAGQAWLSEPRDPRRFARRLAWRLRWWFALLPAGLGWATLRACVRLWLGFSAHHSGVRSAGNGALPRALVLGFLIRDAVTRRAFVDASTRITHVDPLALEAARALAECAALARQGRGSPIEVVAVLREQLRDPRWPLARLERALGIGMTPAMWAAGEGLSEGISGFVVHTLPAAILCWQRGSTAIADALALGGDADSVAALAGGLRGASHGAGELPAAWTDQLIDWPISPAFLTRLADRTLAGSGPEPQGFCVLHLLRNLVFFAVALAHGLRRALPPY